MVREGRVLISGVGGDPDFGASYKVTAFEVGAQVQTASSSTTAYVRLGHGFSVGDKFIVGTDATKYNTVTGVNVNGLELTITAMGLSQGDLLVNLGVDLGIGSPTYNNSGATIYTDMAYGSVANNSEVQTDAFGKYRYYHKGIARWELVRSSSGPIAIYVDTGGLILEASSSPVATGYPLTNVTDVLMKWYRTGDANPLFSFSPLAVGGQYAQLLRVGDRAQTSGDSRILGYFSATIDSPGVIESQALYGINVYTGAGTAAQIGVHGIAQSIPGAGLTQGSIVGVQSYAYHLDTAGGTTTNLFGTSATVSTGTGATYTGVVTNMYGVRGNARNLAANVSGTQMVGVWGLVSDITGVVVNAFGGRFDQPTGATTQNHAVLVYGTDLASIGFTNDLSTFKYIRYSATNSRFETIGAWVCQGSFTSTSAISSQVAGNALILGGNTDADIGIAFNSLTTEGHITYKAATTNFFEFDRPLTQKTTAGITASTTQTQAGGTALVSTINEVSTVANASDTVTLPSAVAGMQVIIINNGVGTLKIYPFLSDNLGAGVDNPRASNLAAGSNLHFVAYNSVNWEEV